MQRSHLQGSYSSFLPRFVCFIIPKAEMCSHIEQGNGHVQVLVHYKLNC
jgi:hypothetical protein